MDNYRVREPNEVSTWQFDNIVEILKCTPIEEIDLEIDEIEQLGIRETVIGNLVRDLISIFIEKTD